ncbi:MAG: hypothetical protein LC723_04890, partial [Actinobacteria bacterium]|nr:hypothetical protein [Actinomycetota bacterium]
MIRRLLIALVIVSAGAYGFAEVSAKRFAEQAIATKAQQVDPVAHTVEAHVSSPLLWGVLSKGLIDEVSVTADHVKLGAYTADRTTGVLHGVHLDRAKSIQERKPVITSIDR